MADYNQYVADLYRNELGRSGDAVSQGEIDAWVNALSSGGLSQQQVADMIERSPEGVNYDLSRVYQSELGRAPDESGIQSWGQALQSGALSDDQFQQMVRQSPEYGAASVAQYQDLLNKIYQQEVGREPDAGGAAQWAAALRSGSIKPEQLPGLFSNTNEGWVFDQYANMFGRKPDPDAYKWIDALEKGALTRDQVLAQLMTSPEYVKNNPTKAGIVVVPKTNTGPTAAEGGFPGYVSAYQNYAPMKPLADPRSQTFGFLYDTINQRLGRDVTPKGLLDVNSINAAFGNSGAGGMVGSAQSQMPASTGGVANTPNLVGGILDARNLVSNVYQQELGRAPDFGGLDSWSNAVYNGMTQQQLVDAIRASSEYRGRLAGNTTAYVPYSYDYPGGGSGNGGDGNGGGAYGGGGDSAAGSPAGDGGGIMG